MDRALRARWQANRRRRTPEILRLRGWVRITRGAHDLPAACRLRPRDGYFNSLLGARKAKRRDFRCSGFSQENPSEALERCPPRRWQAEPLPYNFQDRQPAVVRPLTDVASGFGPGGLDSRGARFARIVTRSGSIGIGCGSIDTRATLVTIRLL